MNYIIYSGGKDGFKFYNHSKNFPESYLSDLRDLYEKFRIIESASEYTVRGVRFAPLRDKFVLSVIYRNCRAKNESRREVAALNYLFEPDEVVNFFSGEIADNFKRHLEHSDKILENAGYKFEVSSDDLQYMGSNFSDAKKKALLASAVNAMNLIPDSDKFQTFVGCGSIGEAYDSLLWLLNEFPVGMRKNISFYLGPLAASETKEVSLVLMEEKFLEKAKEKSYAGSGNLTKLDFFKGVLAEVPKLPEQVTTFLSLSEKEKSTLKEIFKDSDDINSYWSCVSCIKNMGTPGGAVNFLLALGDELAVEYMFKEPIDEVIIENIYTYRNSFSNMKSFSRRINEEMKAINKRKAEAQKKEEETKKAEQKNQENSVKNSVKNDKKKKSKKGKNNTGYEEDVIEPTQETVGEERNDETTIYDVLYAFLENRKPVSHLMNAVLALFIIVVCDVVFFVLIAKFSFDGSKPAFSFEDISTFRYVLTILALNVINIPLGYIFISSALAFLKEKFNRK